MNRTIEATFPPKKVTDFFQGFLSVWKTLLSLSEFSHTNLSQTKFTVVSKAFYSNAYQLLEEIRKLKK